MLVTYFNDTMITELEDNKALLLKTARLSIKYGLEHGCPIPIRLPDYNAALQQPAACFVTLHKHDRLRGCIGQLQANRPLIEDIAANAYAAAFRDPRFPPVTREEYDELSLDISVLSDPTLLANICRDDQVIAQLTPGEDGLIIEKGLKRATFLPSVWQQLPEPADFLYHLKQKAGIAPNDETGIHYYLYHTTLLSE